MGSVRLHHAVDAEDAFENKRKYGHVELSSQKIVGFIELADIVCAIVGREGDAGQNDLGAGGSECRYDAVEVGPCVSDS